MSEYELLLRHAEQWASDKKRVLDAELVELALDLRATQDALPANRWPADSVRHLMLVRWPAHGPAGVPDVEQLVQSLDTFWRFLRSTGRMAGASAEPKSLLAEAKVAAKKMPAACTDPDNYSISKGILDFGSEIGISLDDVESMEEANERLQQIMDAWNAQPDDVRMNRPMGAGSAGSVMGQALNTAADSLLRTGDIPPGWDLPSMPRLDDVEEDDSPLYPNDPAISAPLARSSEFLHQVIALADFADGRELTSIGVLRPAAAREAYQHLDLWAWESRAREWLPEAEGATTEAEHKEIALHGWRSAGDCVPLDRLWTVAVGMGLVDASGRRALRIRDSDPITDQDWVAFALVGAVFLVARTETVYDIRWLLMILFALAEPYGGGPLTMDELVEMHWENEHAELADTVADSAMLRKLAASAMTHQVAAFDDCGWWVHRRGRLELTPLGWDVALVLVRALDEDWF